MTKGNKWFTKRNTENKQNMYNVNPANMWGALGHVTHVAKPVTINKREREGISLRQMKISMVTNVKKTQPVLYPIYMCMLLYDGRDMSRSGIIVQWLNISY